MYHDGESSGSGAVLVFAQQAGEISKKVAHHDQGTRLQGRSGVHVEDWPAWARQGTHRRLGLHYQRVRGLLTQFAKRRSVWVPVIDLVECQLLAAARFSCTQSVGETKDDLFLPTLAAVGEPTDDDKKCTQELLEVKHNCEENTVIVLSAFGAERITQVRLGN